MNQKGFANIILIIFVVVLVGALGYVTLVKKPAPVEQPQTNNNNSQNTQTITPPPSNNAVPQTPPTVNNTTSWKTYSSDLMGIEVKYPPKYYVVKNFGNPGSDTFTSVTNLGKESDKNLWGKEVGGSPAHIQIIYHVNRRNLSIAELAKEWAASAGVASSCKNLTVVGESALRCSLYVEGEGGLYSDMIFLKHSGTTYSFAANSPTPNDIVHTDLLEILATLKFFQ
jgi:hypothetical protein